MVPDTMEDLITLPGVGRKTANVILSSGFGKTAGIVVDTHVIRLSGRLGLTKNIEPEKIEQELMKIVPKNDWAVFSHLLILHGRKICNARKPLCGECGVNKLCPSAFKGKNDNLKSFYTSIRMGTKDIRRQESGIGNL
jgi:endonuclease-3